MSKTTISTMNLGTRILANLIFLFAVITLCTFGIGGGEWGTGFWVSLPFFLLSSGLTFKANHTAVVETRDV